MVFVWSWWGDSNTWPADYESAALPTELHQHFLLWLRTVAIIAYFFATVNTYSPKIHRIPILREYYKWYNCNSPCILPKRFLSPRREISGSQGGSAKKALCHLHGNFPKIRALFFVPKEFFPFSSRSSIDIKNSIISFYKELSTFSTGFSTFNFPLFFNAFLSIFQLITSRRLHISTPRKSRFLLT